MPIASANGIQIAYETFGNSTAPAVVMMRGVGSQLVHWPHELVSGLVQMHLRVVVFDNRDCGLTTHFADRPTPNMGAIMTALARGEMLPPVYRLEDMALDVVGLLDALEIRKAHLVGLSLGGYVGQILAAQSGERLRSFIQLMSSPSVPMPQKMHPRVVEAMMTPPKGPGLRDEEDHALAVARASTGSGYSIDEAHFRDTFRLARSRGVWPGADNRQVLAAMATGDRSARCRRISVPTLVVHGTQDPMVPFDEGRRSVELIPEAQFTPIEGLGHELTPGFAPTLVALLQSFIARI
jgi:pimeloyl-ACP methyl ester carboxylesterase